MLEKDNVVKDDDLDTRDTAAPFRNLRNAKQSVNQHPGALTRTIRSLRLTAKRLSAEFALVVVSDPIKDVIRNVDIQTAKIHVETGQILLKYCQSRFKSVSREKSQQVFISLTIDFSRWISIRWFLDG